MEALRDLADDFNVRHPRKLYQLARQRDLDVTQAMAFEALKADVAGRCRRPGRARAGQVGRTTGCRPTSSTSARTRGRRRSTAWCVDVFTWEAAVEPLQNKNAETVGRATKRAALTGDDGNFVVRRTWATSSPRWTGSCPKMPCAGRSGPRTATPSPWWTGAEEGCHEGDAQGRAVERPLRAGCRGLQRAAPRDGARRARGRGEAAGHEFRVLQDNADKFQHNKDRRVKAVEDAGAFRAPTIAARSFNPQYGDVQRLGAVDSMTVRSTEGRETLLKLALPAPQGSGNAAGRLTRRGRPAAVRQLDDFLAPPRPSPTSLKMIF